MWLPVMFGVVDSDDSMVDGSRDDVNDDDNVQSSSLGKGNKEAKLGPPEASSHLDFTRDAQVVLSHSVPSLIIALYCHHYHTKQSNKQT